MAGHVPGHRVAAKVPVCSAAPDYAFLIVKVSTSSACDLSSSVSPVWRSKLGMSIAASGSVHSMVSRSPLAMPASSFLVRRAGKGHFRPLRLTVLSAIAASDPVLLPARCCGRLRPRSTPVAPLRMAAQHPQAIARLTPLGEALALVEAQVKPVAPARGQPVAGRVLAEDVSAPRRPEAPVALADGWAINADDTLGAGGYTQTVLGRAPERVEVGQLMPAGTDSVAPLDAVQVGASGA